MKRQEENLKRKQNRFQYGWINRKRVKLEKVKVLCMDDQKATLGLDQ